MQLQIKSGTLAQLYPPINTYRVESLKDGVYKTTCVNYVGDENIGHATGVYEKGQTCFIAAHRLYPAQLQTEVVAYGAPSEHKVKAILADGTWLTFYVNTGEVNHHCPIKGGLGRCTAGEFAHPEVLEQLREAYRANA